MAENNCTKRAAPFEHRPKDGKAEIDPVHAGAAVDEYTVGDFSRRDTTGPIHVAVQRREWDNVMDSSSRGFE